MEKEWICDECGEEFSYPNEGKVESGFGICNECYKRLKDEI
jgi:formylmethanofuran dehydrogenase subunit E